MQSATRTAQTTPGRAANDASASTGAATVDASTTVVPCTCRNHAGSAGRLAARRARFASTSSRSSPLPRPRFMPPPSAPAHGPRLAPPSRVVTNARTRGGAGHDGTIQRSSSGARSAIDVVRRLDRQCERPGERGEVGRRRRPPRHRVAGPRMHERQPPRVQRLPAERRPRTAAVRGIADERMTDRLQMNADLVRAARLEPADDERRGPAVRDVGRRDAS